MQTNYLPDGSEHGLDNILHDTQEPHFSDPDDDRRDHDLPVDLPTPGDLISRRLSKSPTPEPALQAPPDTTAQYSQMQNTAAPLPASIKTNNDQEFSIDGPSTRIGRKRKARDLNAILKVCTCGQTVADSEISSGEGVIRCKSVGCETEWVSDHPSITADTYSVTLSTTSTVLISNTPLLN
jgi:hypothetical protein